MHAGIVLYGGYYVTKYSSLTALIHFKEMSSMGDKSKKNLED